VIISFYFKEMGKKYWFSFWYQLTDYRYH